MRQNLLNMEIRQSSRMQSQVTEREVLLRRTACVTFAWSCFHSMLEYVLYLYMI